MVRRLLFLFGAITAALSGRVPLTRYPGLKAWAKFCNPPRRVNPTQTWAESFCVFGVFSWPSAPQSAFIFFRSAFRIPQSAFRSDPHFISHFIDVWAWRADHGTGVGWTSNTASNGLIVNGDNVTAYGLFVEHSQSYQVIWRGENGTTIMFQNEMPYDPPDQASWSHDGIDGFASYKVADGVKSHQGWGLGSYCFFNVNPSIINAHAFEAPTTSGVQFHDLVTVSLGGVGTIEHVINDTGATANTSNQVVDLVSYP
jgi:hypothetical protein